MRQLWSERVKQAVRPQLYRALYANRTQYECPICHYYGPFKDKRISKSPNLVRVDSKCVGCSSAERHRMMSLVVDEVLGNWNAREKSILHIAPEECLKLQLDQLFGTYHTADLLAKNVDFNEDLQCLSFPEASYDAILVSRVLTIPPDLDACLDEMARVLKPGGLAIVAEIFTHEETVEFGEMRKSRSREIGVDLLSKLSKRFQCIDRYLSDQYPAEYRLNNEMTLDGQPKDDYPSLVRIPNVGFKDLVAVCHVDRRLAEE